MNTKKKNDILIYPGCVLYDNLHENWLLVMARSIQIDAWICFMIEDGRIRQYFVSDGDLTMPRIDIYEVYEPQNASDWILDERLNAVKRRDVNAAAIMKEFFQSAMALKYCNLPD